MSQFISVPCKRGYKINYIDAISDYVKTTYGEEQFANNTSQFNEFNDMRNNMLKKLLDKHESTIEVFTRYYDQLVAIGQKIPFGENGAKLEFKWDDAFGSESIFGKSTCLKMISGGYERICVLFNVAALYSQVAEIINVDDDVRLKNAVKYLQLAAGIFSHLKSETSMVIEGERPNDLNVDVLSSLKVIMVAQAQELICIKAARDNMKSGNIAKIVQQVSFLYSEALNLMQLYSVKSLWPKDWILIIDCKQLCYQALAEYYQAMACGENKAYGEKIARLKKASELMKVVSVRAGQKFMFRSDQERIRVSLCNIEKENNVIYHDSVPEWSCLSPISKAVLARELPIDNPMNKDFIDLFDNIIHPATYSAGVMFKNKHKCLAYMEVNKLKEASIELNGVLASLNLPASLMTIDTADVSSILIAKSADLRHFGGVTKLEEMINRLPEVMRENDDLMKEATRLLDEEEDSDKNLRVHFKERWIRTPSPKLTESWRVEATKFNNILLQAKGSDASILCICNAHLPQIKILSQSEDVIKESVLRSKFSADNSEFSRVPQEELRALCDDIESLKKSRIILLRDIPGNVDDELVVRRFCKSLSEGACSSQEQNAEEQINAMLAPLRERVRQSLDLQEQLLFKLREKCSNSDESANPGNDRVAFISSMMVAIEKYFELKCNLEEGLKFYGDLNAILTKFRNKITDFCFARKTEKEELMKDLQGAIVSERTNINSSGASYGIRAGADAHPQYHNSGQQPSGNISRCSQSADYYQQPRPTK